MTNSGELIATPALGSSRSPKARRWRIGLAVPATVLLVYLMIGIFGESLAPYSATDFNTGPALARPSLEHFFGTDGYGRDVFSRVLVEKIEPNLGRKRATILCEYPVSEAALARPKASDPRVAERFELYACGVELANCFGELTDPAEQRRRFEAEMAEKARVYGERYPIDEDFLSALAAMPQASGGALGLDRLVMLATGARHIEQVLWAPVAQS